MKEVLDYVNVLHMKRSFLMSLSRIETKQREQQYKKSNKRKKNRLWLINTTLLAIIIIVVALFYRGENLWLTAKEQVSNFSLFKETKKDSSIVDSGSTNVENEFNDLDDSDNLTNDAGTIIAEDNPIVDDVPVAEEGELKPVDTAADTINLAFVGDILQGEYINN